MGVLHELLQNNDKCSNHPKKDLQIPYISLTKSSSFFPLGSLSIGFGIRMRTQFQIKEILSHQYFGINCGQKTRRFPDFYIAIPSRNGCGYSGQQFQNKTFSRENDSKHWTKIAFFGFTGVVYINGFCWSGCIIECHEG